MNPPDLFEHAAFQRLFQPMVSWPWRWDPDGPAFEWRDETTIVFADEIDLILAAFGPVPAPPFPVIILVLAALRGKGISLAEIESITPPVERFKMAHVLDGLASLATLPPPLTQTAEAKATLLNLICPRSKRLEDEIPTAHQFTLWSRYAETGTPRNGELTELVPYLLMLSEGISEFTPSGFAAVIRTGLVETPQPDAIELKLPPAISVRQFLKNIPNDSELSGIAALSQDILAALRLPHRLPRHSDNAFGGYVDLSNRGTPERLTLSELAAEPDTLAVRVLLGEALYLKPEPPAQPARPKPQVLLDVTLPMWGVPRLFGFSVAMALFASRDSLTDSSCSISITRDTTFETHPANSEESLVALLGMQDIDSDAIPAINDFLMPLEETDVAELERFVVTHRETLELPDLGPMLRRIPACFFATVDAAGQFQLHHHPAGGGLKLILEATFTMDALFRTPNQHRILQSPFGERLPAFCLYDPVPMLMAAHGKMHLARKTLNKTTFYAIMESGRMLRWQKNGRGAEEIKIALEARSVSFFHLFGRGPRNSWAVLISDRTWKTVLKLLVSQDEGPVSILDFPQPIPAKNGITAVHDMAFLIDDMRVTPMSLTTGISMAEQRLPSPSRRVLPNGVLELANGKMARITWNGATAEITILQSYRKEHHVPIDPVFYFIVASTDRLATVWEDWEITLEDESADMPKSLISGGTIRKGKISKCIPSASGETLLIRTTGENSFIYNVSKKSFSPAGSITETEFLRHGEINLIQNGALVNVTLVGFSAEGNLCVRTSGGVWFHLILQPVPTWIRRNMAPPAYDTRGFESPKSSPFPLLVGECLKSATWPRGIIYLDSRGFLHIMPSSPEQPEATVSCNSSTIAIWFPGEQPVGSNFYLRESTNLPPHKFAEAATRLEKLLRSIR